MDIGRYIDTEERQNEEVHIYQRFLKKKFFDAKEDTHENMNNKEESHFFNKKNK